MTFGQKAGYAAVLGVGLLVQMTWACSWRLWGVYPDLYLVLAICAGLTLGMRRGAAVGLALGYIEGAMLGQSMGSFMVSRAVVAFLAGLAETRVYRENLGVPVACVFAATLVGELIFLIMSPNYAFALWTITILKEAPFNSLLAAAFFPPLAYFTRTPLKGVTFRASL